MGYGQNQFNQRVSVWLDDEAIGTETAFHTVLAPWDGDTEWHHVAVVFPPGAGKTTDLLVYLDGRPQDTTAGGASDIDTTAGDLTVGCQAGTNNLFFTGIIDDVAIFPRELTAEEIASVALKGLVGARDVSPQEKLATAWGSIKAH